MRSIEGPTKQSHTQFSAKQFLMRHLRLRAVQVLLRPTGSQ
jgi:hypothetical protein